MDSIWKGAFLTKRMNLVKHVVAVDFMETRPILPSAINEKLSDAEESLDGDVYGYFKVTFDQHGTREGGTAHGGGTFWYPVTEQQYNDYMENQDPTVFYGW